MAGAPAIPAEFQDLARGITRRLDAFDETLSASWDGTRHPVTPAATLLSANGNRGLQLLAPGVPGAVDLELDRLSALGLRAVTVSVNYPLLDPVFLAESGRPEVHGGILNFYESVASKVRLRGMKLTVETGAMFPGIYSEGSGLDAGPFFAKLTDSQYVAGRTAQAVAPARSMRPDALDLGSEPDTESRLSGKSAFRSPAAFASMVRGMVESIQAEGQAGVALVSGTGTWDSRASSCVAALVEIPGLWGIDLHVYPDNRDFLDRVLTLADQVRVSEKHVTMLECWLQKVRDSELGTIDSAFDSTAFPRDSWTFWEPLDRRFFSAMVRPAHAARIDYVSAFWSRLFFGNLDHAAMMAASPPPGSDAIIRLAIASAAESILSGKTTPTGRSFSALIIGEPTELTAVKSVPVVLETAGASGARYSTELILANRGTTPVQATLSYTPAVSLGASGEGEVAIALSAGRQIALADTVAYLRECGLLIPVGSNQGGMFQITFRGASSADVLSAGARTTTPSGSGRAGLSYPAVATHDF